tara:strand:+ start:878 stop:1003 length:126 start_codon:yes stop_codon:yes gene_type:complete
MAEEINEKLEVKSKKNETKPCPSGFARDPRTGRCIQLPVGP